jgi:hypothetical protein
MILAKKIFILIIIIFSKNNYITLANNNEFAHSFNPDLKPLEVSGKAIKWQLFATTTEKTICVIDEEGFDDCLITPVYSPEIKELDQKPITLTGFMFPLDPSEQQKNFLLGPYPSSCPFSYHVSPSQIIEVNSQTAIKFSYDPITIKGKLLVKYNEETGVFYYLEAP